MNLRTVHVISNNKKPHSKEYKLMALIFKTLHILFGFDLGFFAHKSYKFRFILNIISFIHCVTVGVLLFLKIYNNEINFTSCWTVVYFFSWSTILLVSFFKRGSTFMHLQESLEEIDGKLRVDFSGNHTKLKLILTLFFIYIERLFVIGFYRLISTDPYALQDFLDEYTFLFLSACTDIFLSCYSFMFYSLYLRLTKLSHMLKINHDIDSVQRLYEAIVDTVEKYKRVFDALYVVILICNVPQVMTSVYRTLKELHMQTDLVTFMTLGVEYSFVILVMVLTVTPALIAEMMTSEAEEIKTILHQKRFLCDVQQKESLTWFIQYVEARPCRFRVWKLIPLSTDLIGIILSFCATYLIVIIQFTNFK